MDEHASDSPLTEQRLSDLQKLQPLLPEVRQLIKQHLPLHWPDLADVINDLIDAPLDPLAVLPLASCAAVQGNPRAAIPLAAAWTVLNLGIRLLDDVQDQDRQSSSLFTYGMARTVNFGVACYALCNQLLATASWPATTFRVISQEFAAAALRVLSGQDRDLRHATHSLEDYWQTIADKNARLFSMICAAGALCGTAQLSLVGHCRVFGHHLGIVLQLFDDLEGLWQPEDRGDMEYGKITLPILYGLNTIHPERAQFEQLIDNAATLTAEQAKMIRTILDTIHTKEFIVWAALQEREHALTSLSKCPGRVGVVALTAYIDVLFAQSEPTSGALWGV